MDALVPCTHRPRFDTSGQIENIFAPFDRRDQKLSQLPLLDRSRHRRKSTREPKQTPSPQAGAPAQRQASHQSLYQSRTDLLHDHGGAVDRGLNCANTPNKERAPPMNP